MITAILIIISWILMFLAGYLLGEIREENKWKKSTDEMVKRIEGRMRYKHNPDPNDFNEND